MSAVSKRDGWARLVTTLRVGDVPAEALNLNVDGRRLSGPVQGFGRLWQKTFRLPLHGLERTPPEVMAVWRENFGAFWPHDARFYAPLIGLEPGEVALLNAGAPGREMLSTGVMVLHADDTSFTFITPEGHPFSGWITFSAHVEDGTTLLQIHELFRAADPLYELGMTFMGHGRQNRFWQHSLAALAARLGSAAGDVETVVVCVDRGRQWRRAGNLRRNAALRTAAHLVRGRRKTRS